MNSYNDILLFLDVKKNEMQTYLGHPLISYDELISIELSNNVMLIPETPMCDKGIYSCYRIYSDIDSMGYIFIVKNDFLNKWIC